MNQRQRCHQLVLFIISTCPNTFSRCILAYLGLCNCVLHHCVSFIAEQRSSYLPILMIYTDHRSEQGRGNQVGSNNPPEIYLGSNMVFWPL